MFDSCEMVLIDLDGSLWSGSHLYDGAIELLEALIQSGRMVLVLSNNSVVRGHTVKDTFVQKGLSAEINVLTVVDVAGSYIRERLGCSRIRVFGSSHLADVCESEGHQIVEHSSSRKADVVLLGLSTLFNYAWIQQIAACVARGEHLIVTNPDRYHPGLEGQRIPETGSLLASVLMIQDAPYDVIGKPSPYLFQKALQCGHVVPDNPSTVVMVGDNVETDIQGAHNAGTRSIWLSHGRAYPEKSIVRPTLIVKNVRDLCSAVESGMAFAARP